MNKVLIANRGEIALRIIRSCRRLNIATVAVYSDADRLALHVREADEACYIGPTAVEQSYLNIKAVLTAAHASGAEAVHPGYGFLSENPEFAEAVQAAGLTWIGPAPESMRKMASKISAREIAEECGVPVIPAFVLTAGDPTDTGEIISTVGLPLLVKSSAGGGGIGMREVHQPEDLAAAIDDARDQALRQFGSGDLLVERLIPSGRHVEVQVVGDQHGKLLHLFERDCSAQRRRQKLLEEAPAPGLSTELRQSLLDAALRLASAVAYQGVGTVEFLLDGNEFYLLEMNTRLQVEHGVTEAICDVDLVRLQMDIARGRELKLNQADIACRGHAIEARIYAEDPRAGFRPSTGTVAAFSRPNLPGLRIDSGVTRGSEIGHHYDGMLCKLIVHGETREAATRQLQTALAGLRLAGLASNQQLLRTVLDSPDWGQGLHTSTLESKLPGLLAAAEMTAAQTDLTLVAATVWQFRHSPPAADQLFWPGARHQQRQSNWLCAGKRLDVNWTWTAATEFLFPDLALNATLLEESGDSDRLVLEIDGRRQVFRILDQADSLWLWHPELGNLQLKTLHNASGAIDPGQDDHCRSHGPGQVLRVLVTPGQQVEPQEPLVVIESMKMESTLGAPRAGRIAEVAVSEGDLIASGQLLLRMEESRQDG